MMAAAAAEATLRICQFNVLAPSARICAPLDRVPWQARHRAVVQALRDLEPDIVALQEFDFAPGHAAEFAALYEEGLGGDYARHELRRTRGKKEGLALLLRRAAFEEVSVQDVFLEPAYCDRVAQVASMRHAASGRLLRVANTHLTVAHPSNDTDIPVNRPRQMEQVLGLLRGGGPRCCTFLCADMNCDHLETEAPATGKVDCWGRSARRAFAAAEVSAPVQMAFDAGFRSAFHALHPDVRPVSHTSDYAQDGCVDYVFFRQGEARATDAFLHPRELRPDAPWSRETGWGTVEGTLSDHRPLVADFRLGEEEEELREE